MYQTIFLKENEKDIFQALKEQGIKTKVFEHRLADLFNRVYNNYVGYYVFKQNDLVYKMIVLPKTIDQSDENAEKKFVDYLLHYYRINNIYKFDKEKKIPNSLLKLAFESNHSKERSHDFLDEFQLHRYKAILETIEDFFKRHKNSKRVTVGYVSQSVKHKLNLKENIKELDKTKIHQTQSTDVVFSMLATVTYNALKLFITQKYREKHFSEVSKIQAMLLKKYKIERGYRLSLATLQGLKLSKLFAKTEENRQLLVNIKSLFGFEQMYRDNVVSVEYREDLMTTSLFINPNNFYEWYVYDILKKYDDENRTILFDKIESKTTTSYKLTNEKSQVNKKSQPDYIIIDEDKKVKVVIDAKWKQIETLSDISSGDYLKLQFDSSLLDKNGYVTSSYFVYPHLAMGNSCVSVKVEENSIFDFNVIEISMEFEKHGNSLDFDFDMQELKKSIELNSQIEKLKSTSEELGDTIATKRTEIITQLIAEKDNEKKDELKSELDKQLIHSAFALSEQLDEKVLLPEIEEILNNYEDILEEESKKFLKSSSAIYSYYKKKHYAHFDYSMPGSGFWKLIELELNTSFIWHIRIESRVCNTSCPWTNISVPNQKVSHRIQAGSNVVLNKSEIDDELRLQGVMLGGIRLLSLDQNTLNQFFMNCFSSDKVSKKFIEDDLAVLIEKVSRLRNEHAHIKAMSLEKFEELWDVLFEDGNSVSSLKKLLEFKKSIKAQYE